MRVTLLSSCVSGCVDAPPSKSMAHRLCMAAALANGTSRIENLSFSQDIRATLSAMQQLGAAVEVGKDFAVITGVGGAPFPCVTQPVDCCESGSTLRFIVPLFSQTDGPVHFIGRGRLMARPQEIYAEMFRAQGLSFAQNEQGITIDGALSAGEYVLSGDVSSQFISGLLFCLPLLGGDSIVRVLPPFESRSYVDLTLSALEHFGIHITWQEENTLLICGNQHYCAHDDAVEGDYSQAAFWAVLGAVCGGITVQGLSPESLQGDAVILSILKRCGANFVRHGNAVSFEKSTLTATEIDLADCPDLGPILMVLGLFCEGETIIRNAGRLREKESDRIAAMECEIGKIGGIMHAQGDTVFVQKSTLHSAENLFGHNDHRIVMAMSIAALAGGICVTLEGAQAVNKSYPDFFSVLQSINAEVKIDETT